MVQSCQQSSNPPTEIPTTAPTENPTMSPTQNPSMSPSESPTTSPTESPSMSPSESPITTTTGGAYTCGSTMEECEAAYLAASTPAITVMEPTMTLDGCDEIDASWASNVVNGLTGWDAE